MTTDSLRQRVALQDELLTRAAERSLREFVRQAWHILEPGKPLIPNFHIDLICESLEAITAGEITRLLINVPPRYMKTLLVSLFWPTWEWIRRPTERWIFSSYSEALSSKHSLDRRTVIQSPWYQGRWGHLVQLATDQNVKLEFQNTKRGVMVATSVSGSITGKGGGRIVFDDPHNPTHGDSEPYRQTVLDYFTKTLSTRLDDKRSGAIVVVGQRVHEHDLSALCIDLDYTHICLEAEAETRQVYVFPRSGRQVIREVGEVLWPAREDREQLAAQRRVLGSTAYASQYQQHPVPSGGAIFKRESFEYYEVLPELDELILSWDMSYKAGRDSDFVVGLVVGRRGADIYVIDRVKGQWDFAETLRRFQHLVARYPKATAKLVEEAANGYAIVSALSGAIPGVIAVSPQGGKQSRALAAQPLVESRNVHVPHPRPGGHVDPTREWVGDLVDQLVAFPKGRHDDDVDAFSQAIAYFLERPFVAPASAVRQPDTEDTQSFDRLSSALDRFRRGRFYLRKEDDDAEDD